MARGRLRLYSSRLAAVLVIVALASMLIANVASAEDSSTEPASVQLATTVMGESRFEISTESAPVAAAAPAPVVETAAPVGAQTYRAIAPDTSARAKRPAAPKTRQTTAGPKRRTKPAGSATVTSKTAKRTKAQSSSEAARARALLNAMIARYPILKGSTIRIGRTPGGHQAVCYYRSARIVVSPDHRASLSRIVRHEAWHIIDWRDNHHIDWGERVPR